jgi:hypothetical protein
VASASLALLAAAALCIAAIISLVALESRLPLGLRLVPRHEQRHQTPRRDRTSGRPSIGRRGQPVETGRIEAFSDGVFAIAITLLVLDIGIRQRVRRPLERDLSLAAYLAYATSFLTIGGIWLAHHGVFRRLRYGQHVMRINLLLLAAVSFLPFPTRLVSEAIRDQSAERAAAIFYGACHQSDRTAVQRALGAVARKPRATPTR